MRSVILIALVAYALSSAMINRAAIEKIKKVAKFKVYDLEKNPFRDWTTEEIRHMLGAKVKPSRPHKKVVVKSNDEYDFRKEHPECMLGIRDQMACGSCWAFSEVMALQERYCLKSGGEIKVVLSPQDPVSCDYGNMGCNGGWLDVAWEYLEKTGCVDEDCFPYTAGEGDVEDCITECKNGAPWKKYKATNIATPYSIDAIKEEIKTNGPIQVGFTVYSDFMNYQGGIYEYSWGMQEGGHAVVNVGYGQEDGKDYWICQNSWNENWGEDGYFRIKMGECGIEDQAIAGLPVL